MNNPAADAIPEMATAVSPALSSVATAIPVTSAKVGSANRYHEASNAPLSRLLTDTFIPGVYSSGLSVMTFTVITEHLPELQKDAMPHPAHVSALSPSLAADASSVIVISLPSTDVTMPEYPADLCMIADSCGVK